MNAGELRDKIEIMELYEAVEGVWDWRVKNTVYAKAEHQTSRSIFSRNGISAQSIKFTIREYPELTLHNAVNFATDNGKHCFVSDINRDMRSHYVLTAALVEPVRCVIERVKIVKGELNRPKKEQLPTLEFPGMLTEKYTRQEQREPMSYSEVRYVLVTPKVITIEVGQLVRIGGEAYEIVIPHTLDLYKNEYEILRKADN